MSIETLQSMADSLRTIFMIAALIAFAAIVAWTLLRPRERVEADAQLWKDDET
jgi:cbb3-type cytochrome oxidase subunit 3